MQSEYEGIGNTVFVISAVILILIGFIFTVLVVYYIRIKKAKERQAEMESQFAQTLLQTQLEIQEQTLQHISREIHDNLSQTASLIKINLNTLQVEDKGKALDKIEFTKDLTRQLITDLKTLSVSLNGDRIGQHGLAKALDNEAEKINRTGVFATSFVIEGNNPTIDTDKAVILYRMAQEILNNMIKYSKAPHIKILLKASGNLLTLAISDDGAGFDVEESLKNGGAGLHNLQNRARLINAHLTINSTPGNGSFFSIDLPLQ